MADDTTNTVTIHYYDEAEKHYISMYMLHSVRCVEGCFTYDHPCPLKVTLLQVKKEVRNFGGARTPATVFKLVVMDGSQYVFLCTLNTGRSPRFSNVDLNPGATLVLSDYKWFTLEPPSLRDGYMTRSFCLVNKIDVQCGPKIGEWTSDDETAVTIEYTSVHIDENVIDYVMDKAYVVFTYPVSQTKNGDYILGLMSKGDIKKAMFISDDQTRRSFLDKKKKRSLENTPPRKPPLNGKEECTCDDHGHMVCVLQTFPLKDVDVDDLFNQVEDRMKIMAAVSFESLTSTHQRWAFYWWYAINVFHIRGMRKPLPSCFLQEFPALPRRQWPLFATDH